MPDQPLWAIVPALDLVDLALQTCEDLLAQTHPTRVLLIDQGSSEESNQAFRAFAERHHPTVLLWSFTPPLPSLSTAWNLGLRYVWRQGGEQALVVNDDVRLHPCLAFQLLRVQRETNALFVSGVGVREADWHPEAYTFGGSQGGPDFSCFLLTRAGHERYPFDVKFVPAFCEDLDAHRRYMLGGDGARIFSVNLPFLHIQGGSRTINRSPEARQAFERLAEIGRRHYEASWGGPPNLERYAEKGEPDSERDGVTTPELQARVQAELPALEEWEEPSVLGAGIAVRTPDCICPNGGADGLYDVYCKVPGHSGRSGLKLGEVD